MRTRHFGFTLIELMIVIAIIGILAAIAVPKYNTYQKRTKFLDVIMAAGPYKTAAELAVQQDAQLTVADLTAGDHGIPEPLLDGESVSPYVRKVTIFQGRIRAHATNLIDKAVFETHAVIVNGGIRWEQTATQAKNCLNLGYC